MSAEPQQPDSAHDDSVSAALHLQAVRRRRLRLVGGGAQEAEAPGDATQEVDRPVGSARARRRPLASAPGRARRRRIPLIIATFLGVLLTLGFALLMNITISQNQYDLVQLRAQEQDLTERNQALNQEIEFQQAPQNLAARASQLGMVSQAQQAQLDLRTGKLNGTPQAAEALGEDPKEAAEQGQTNLIAPPKGSDTEAAQQAQQRAAEQQKKDEAAQKKADEQKAQERASASPSASQSGQAGDGRGR